ncbi:MAG: hypothetical protein KatS3mg084_0274 [Candidatus Dojkabacteria bacterium]|nr:MAG: hypothetical protein KatS3mg084_0274 [Candidatus Dojkabacteria bacterium]
MNSANYGILDSDSVRYGILNYVKYGYLTLYGDVLDLTGCS